MNTVTFIFLATLFYVGQPEVKENLFSYALTFTSYEQCETFFDDYGDKLLNGVIDHGTNTYGQEVGIDYFACAKVAINMQMPGEPEVLGQKVMYQR